MNFPSFDQIEYVHPIAVPVVRSFTSRWACRSINSNTDEVSFHHVGDSAVGRPCGLSSAISRVLVTFTSLPLRRHKV
jgi:hypothetical protein